MPAGTASREYWVNSEVRRIPTISYAARWTSSANSRVKNIGVSEIRKSAGHRSALFTQATNAAYFSGEKSALKPARSSGSIQDSRRFNLHDANRARLNGRSILIRLDKMNRELRRLRGLRGSI